MADDRASGAVRAMGRAEVTQAGASAVILSQQRRAEAATCRCPARLKSARPGLSRPGPAASGESTSSSSSSRPTRGVRPPAAWKASKRLSSAPRPEHLPGPHGRRETLDHRRASGFSSSNRSPTSRRVYWRRSPRSGSAPPWSRAARFGVSPTTPLLRLPSADKVPDHHQPGGNADPNAQRSPFLRVEFCNAPDHREPRLDGPFGIVLMSLRISEIHEHAIAQVLCNDAFEPPGRLRLHGRDKR